MQELRPGQFSGDYAVVLCCAVRASRVRARLIVSQVRKTFASRFGNNYQENCAESCHIRYFDCILYY